MALKAGLVGVNPKGVDKNGMPIGSGGSGVDEAQLTANGKKFFFAYDETSEKYGYKLDGAGDFIPFESAGSGPGWVKPADLITTGLQYYRCEYVEGGYYIDGKLLYVDIVVKVTNSGAVVYGFPAYDEAYAGSSYAQAYNYGALPEEYEYIDRAHDSVFGTSGLGNQVSCPAPNNYYKHVWGCMKLA